MCMCARLCAHKRACVYMHNGLCQWSAKSAAWRNRPDCGGSSALVTPCAQVRRKEKLAGEQAW